MVSGLYKSVYLRCTCVVIPLIQAGFLYRKHAGSYGEGHEKMGLLLRMSCAYRLRASGGRAGNAAGS